VRTTHDLLRAALNLHSAAKALEVAARLPDVERAPALCEFADRMAAAQSILGVGP
jgi:hypothetical protein